MATQTTELPPRNNCRRGNSCLIHLHSAAGHAWLLRRLLPFHRIQFPDNIPRYRVTHNNRQRYQTEIEIMASHFNHLKRTAQISNRRFYQSALVVLPSIFKKRHLHSNICSAASLAGFKSLLFLDRAFIAAYNHSFISTQPKSYLVFELGDGNLEITLLTPLLHVRSSVEDTGCPLYDSLSNRIGIDLSDDWSAMIRLRKTCEIAKDELCSGEPTTVLNFHHQEKTVSVNLNAEDVVDLNLDFVSEKIYECLIRGMAWEDDDVDEIILVGDSTVIPEVLRVISDIFPNLPLVDIFDMQDNAEVVAYHMSFLYSTHFLPLVNIFNMGDFFFY